jgi:hypothetical protein
VFERLQKHGIGEMVNESSHLQTQSQREFGEERDLASGINLEGVEINDGFEKKLQTNALNGTHF